MESVKKGRGRPTKFDQKKQDKIITALKQGSYVESAAAFAGIDKVTLYRWLKRGAREIDRLENAGPRAKVKKTESVYVDFCNAVEQAMAEAEIRDLTTVSKAAKDGDWRAAAWRLERRHPKKWGRQSNVEAEIIHSGGVDHSHEHEHEHNVEHKHSVDSALEKYIGVIEKLVTDEAEESDDHASEITGDDN